MFALNVGPPGGQKGRRNIHVHTYRQQTPDVVLHVLSSLANYAIDAEVALYIICDQVRINKPYTTNYNFSVKEI